MHPWLGEPAALRSLVRDLRFALWAFARIASLAEGEFATRKAQRGGKEALDEPAKGYRVCLATPGGAIWGVLSCTKARGSANRWKHV